MNAFQILGILLGTSAIVVLLMMFVVLPLARKLDKRDEGKEGR